MDRGATFTAEEWLAIDVLHEKKLYVLCYCRSYRLWQKCRGQLFTSKGTASCPKKGRQTNEIIEKHGAGDGAGGEGEEGGRMTARRVLDELDVDVPLRKVQRTLQLNENLAFRPMVARPRLVLHHKKVWYQ